MSLEELSKEVKQLEDFMTVSEEILEREKLRDQELYEREQQRLEAAAKRQKSPEQVAKNAKKPSKKFKPTTLKINKASKNGGGGVTSNSSTPRQSPSKELVRLYFKNGKVRCMDCDDLKLSLKQTKQTVKMILSRGIESPLVCEERVQAALMHARKSMGIEDEIYPSTPETIEEDKIMVTDVGPGDDNDEPVNQEEPDFESK